MIIRGFLIMAACLSCLGCRTTDSSHPPGPAASAGDPPALRTQARSTAGNTVVFAYYFHRTFRCLTCEMTETTADREIQEHFAQPLQDGRLVWMPVNLEEPAGKALAQQFHARTSELALVRMENGVPRKSKTLDELGRLLDRPDAFSKYLIDEINAFLSPAPER